MLLVPPTSTPSKLPSLLVPEGSVPMKLPSIVLPLPPNADAGSVKIVDHQSSYDAVRPVGTRRVRTEQRQPVCNSCVGAIQLDFDHRIVARGQGVGQ